MHGTRAPTRPGRAQEALAESVRLVDTVARYAVDQFMLLAPGPDGLFRGHSIAELQGHLIHNGEQRLSVIRHALSEPG